MKTYRFIDGEYECLIEIKHSKFIATIKGEVFGDSADEFVQSIKRKYPDATHNCYAYIGDTLGNATRFSDDGEPSGTAGQPMLEVLRKQNLVASAVVVTRYFGGIKLGAGGLVSAYTSSVVGAIDNAKISTKCECQGYEIVADYSMFAQFDKYFRRNNILVDSTDYQDDVKVKVFVKLDETDKFVEDLKAISNGDLNLKLLNIEYMKIENL